MYYLFFCSWDGTYDVSMQPNVVVNSNGHVMWRPPAVFKSLCKMEVAFFPFDVQECEMIFSSINYDRLFNNLILHKKGYKCFLVNFIN